MGQFGGMDNFWLLEKEPENDGLLASNSSRLL
jgi:hypothetical protein